MVSSDLPEPPYDSDVAANGYSFEVDLPRMQNSDSWLLCPPEVRPWMMMTWVLSWAQHPCGSLPGDDELIAVRLGCTLDFFQVHRRHILRGWVLHDDGRFYHPVVTERVIKMLEKREGWKVRQGRRRSHDDAGKAPKEAKQAPQSTLDEPVTRESRVSHAGVTGESRSGSSSSSSSSTYEQAKACSSSLSPSSPSPPAAADAAGVSERSDPAPTPTAQAATDAPPPRSAPKPKVTPWPRFDDFWSAYPNKKAKEDARRAWNRMRPPPDVIDTILADLPHRATSDRIWLDGYIPNPATYLNGRRWEDVITPTTAVKTNGSRVVSLAERNAAVFDDFLRGTGTNGVIEGECQRV